MICDEWCVKSKKDHRRKDSCLRPADRRPTGILFFLLIRYFYRSVGVGSWIFGYPPTRWNSRWLIIPFIILTCEIMRSSKTTNSCERCSTSHAWTNFVFEIASNGVLPCWMAPTNASERREFTLTSWLINFDEVWWLVSVHQEPFQLSQYYNYTVGQPWQSNWLESRILTIELTGEKSRIFLVQRPWEKQDNGACFSEWIVQMSIHNNESVGSLILTSLRLDAFCASAQSIGCQPLDDGFIADLPSMILLSDLNLVHHSVSFDYLSRHSSDG